MKKFLFGFLAFFGAVRAQPVPEDHHAAIEASYAVMMNAAHSGDFAKARALCQQAIEWEPRNPRHRYEFACIEAIIAQKETDLAFTALSQAVTLGFDRGDALQADPDLVALRADPRFAKIVAAVQRAAAATPTVAPSPVATVAPGAAIPVAVAERPAPAAFRNGTPVGLYFMTRYWSYTHTLEKAAWYFAPDGTVYENLEHGFSAADLALHTGRKGTAHLAGGKLAVVWAGGETEESEIESDGTGFGWDMGSFTPVQPLPDAAAMAGAYEGGESLSHGGNQVAVSKRLDLRADGTFGWEGVSFLAGNTATTQLYAGATGGGTTGKWSADGYALTLVDSAGHVLRGIAFPYDTGTTPGRADHLFFAGIMYKRL